MAVKLRLKRMGAKRRPFYRIVAADSRSPRDGRFIEVVGTYNPILKENKVTLDEEKVLKWLNSGAQPTDTVKSILTKEKVLEKYMATKTKKTPKKEVSKASTTETKKPAAKKPVAKKAPAKKATTKKAGK